MHLCFLQFTLKLSAFFLFSLTSPSLTYSFLFVSLFALLFSTYTVNNISSCPSSRCFIPNIYAALCTAVLVPLICLVAVLVVFIHAYQVTQQWKAYDDIYRGRTNSTGTQLTCIYAKYTNILMYMHNAAAWFWKCSCYILHFSRQKSQDKNAHKCNHTISLYISHVHYRNRKSSLLPGCPQEQDCIHPYFSLKVLAPILLTYSLCICLLNVPSRSMICS